MSAHNRQRRHRADRPAPTPPPPVAVEVCLATPVVLCTRVGHAADLPPGIATTDCSRCAAAVWIDPDLLELLGPPAGLVLCDGCVGELCGSRGPAE